MGFETVEEPQAAAPQETAPLEIRVDVTADAKAGNEIEDISENGEKEKAEGGDEEGSEAEAAREAKVELDILNAERSMEARVTLLAKAKENVMHNMDAVKISAENAARRYKGLGGIAGQINSEKVSIVSGIDAIKNSFERQAKAAERLDIDPEEALSRLERFSEETYSDFAEVIRASEELRGGADNLNDSLSATFISNLAKAESIFDFQEVESKGGVEAMVQHDLKNFLDRENPLPGTAGALSKLLGDLGKKMSGMDVIDREAQNEFRENWREREERDAKERAATKAPANKIEEITLVGGKDKDTDEGKEADKVEEGEERRAA